MTSPRLIWTDSRGATAVEYAMLAMLIGVAIIAGAGALGGAVAAKYQTAATSVTAAP